jgi:hypothetical protein
MKGHVRKRGKGWVYVVDLPRGTDGRRRQNWSTSFDTKREAEAALSKTLTEINKGSYIEPSNMLVREYLQRWLDDYAQHNCSSKTVERYADLIRNHISPALGSLKLRELKPFHLQELYSKALCEGRKDGNGGLSPRTVHHIHRLLHNALNSAVNGNCCQ